MAGLGTAPLDPHARSCLHEGTVALLTCLAKQAVIGTFNALAKEDSVESDGEIEPFSILDNMPADMPEATPNSATVKSMLPKPSDLRTDLEFECRCGFPSVRTNRSGGPALWSVHERSSDAERLFHNPFLPSGPIITLYHLYRMAVLCQCFSQETLELSFPILRARAIRSLQNEPLIGFSNYQQEGNYVGGIFLPGGVQPEPCRQ